MNTKRLSTKELINDLDISDELKCMSDYAPLNSRFSVANIKSLYEIMVANQTIEAHADAVLHAARVNAIAAEWNFHNAILGSKDQVKNQFGIDISELQALNLKKT